MGMRGKDGVYYNNVNEAKKADAKWEQQERQNKLLEEQNRIMKQQYEEQNRLIKQQYEEQYRREKEMAEERRQYEIRRRIELEEQANRQKERLFIENLDETGKKLYSTYKGVVDDTNKIIDDATELKDTYIDKKQNTYFSLLKSFNKLKYIGFSRFMIILAITSFALVFFLYENIEMGSDSSIGLIIFFAGLVATLIESINFTKKQFKIKQKSVDIKKDINNIVKEFDKLDKIDEPEQTDFLYAIELTGVYAYADTGKRYSEEVLKIVNGIDNKEKDINDRINQIKDELNSNYKKKSNAKEDTPIKSK